MKNFIAFISLLLCGIMSAQIPSVVAVSSTTSTEFSTINCQDPLTQVVYAYNPNNSRIWAYNGSTITILPATPAGFTIQSVTVHQNSLCVGGYSASTSKSALYKWNGVSFISQSLPSFFQAGSATFNKNMNQMASFNGLLYFIGDKDLYSWNGSAVVATHTVNSSSTISNLSVANNNLYISGMFTAVNNNSLITTLAKIDPSNTIFPFFPTTMTMQIGATQNAYPHVKYVAGKLHIFGAFRGTNIQDSGYYQCSETNLNGGFYKKIFSSKNTIGADFCKGTFFLQNSLYTSKIRTFTEYKSNSLTDVGVNSTVGVYQIGGKTIFIGDGSSATGFREISLANFTHTINISQPLCSGNSGTVSMSATGNYTPTSYNWYNSGYALTSTLQSANLPSGTNYSLVFDDLGRWYVDTFAINNPTIPLISVLNGTTCQNSNYTIIPTGGSSYTLFPGNIAGTNFTTNVLSTSSYTLQGTSIAGCSMTQTVITVSTPTPISFSFSINGESSIGASNGSITTTVTAGTYSWSNGSTSSNISGLSSGWYYLNYTSTQGCTQKDSVFVPLGIITGIHENNNKILAVFPTVTENIVNLYSLKEWILINNFGLEIQNGIGGILNLEKRENGIYYIKSDNKTYKLILSK